MLYHPSMKTFDVFLNKSIKFLLVVNIIIILTICSFFVQPVFAVNDSAFDNQPIYHPVANNQDNWINGDSFGPVASGLSGFAKFGSTTDDVYIFGVPSTLTNGNVALTFYGCVDFQAVDFTSTTIYRSTGEYIAQSYSLPYNITTSSAGISYIGLGGYTMSSVDDLTCPYFSTVEEGCSALRSYLDTPSEPNIYEGFRLPPGYSARIQLSSGGHFDVSCTMGELCATSGSWIDNSQKYLYSDSAAVGSALDSGSLINWAPSGNLTAYGQTYEAFYSFSSVPSGTYMWITNPVYMNVANQYLDSPSINGTIVLSNVVNVQQIRLFPLSTDIGKSGIGSSGSDDDYFNAVESNGAIIYEGSDGSTSSSLPEYGNTNVPGSSGNQGIIERFQSLLEDLVSRIESLLIAPVTYIQRIISAGSTFFTWLSGLWSWLPGPVSGIITSVLYVMAVVGALKLLWR